MRVRLIGWFVPYRHTRYVQSHSLLMARSCRFPSLPNEQTLKSCLSTQSSFPRLPIHYPHAGCLSPPFSRTSERGGILVLFGILSVPPTPFSIRQHLSPSFVCLAAVLFCSRSRSHSLPPPLFVVRLYPQPCSLSHPPPEVCGAVDTIRTFDDQQSETNRRST